MLIAIDALERACQLGDEDGDGVVFCFQASNLQLLKYVIFDNDEMGAGYRVQGAGILKSDHRILRCAVYSVLQYLDETS